MSSMREGIPLDALNWFGRAIRNSHPKISRPWRVKNLGFVCSPSFFSLPAACRLFSRGVIFTWARVSLALLSLRKNGGLLVVYLVPSGNSASQTSSANKLRAARSTDQSTRVLHDLKELKDLQHQSLTSMQQLIAAMNSLISLMEVFLSRKRKRHEMSESESSERERAKMAGWNPPDIKFPTRSMTFWKQPPHKSAPKSTRMKSSENLPNFIKPKER